MNYRHAFHAGNFADCMKHALLVWLLGAMARKPAGFFVLDTHAGRGEYDLNDDPALRTGEAQSGIARLLAAPDPALAEYLSLVHPPIYPGSPALIRALLRPQDRMACCELHPEDHAALRRRFPSDRQAAVHLRDGWEAIGALLPPAERRCLVLIDPPYEVPNEFDLVLQGLRTAHARCPAAVLVGWYPIKHRAPLRGFHAAIQTSGLRDVVTAELWLRAPLDPAKLNGCGLVVVNPPYRFAEEAPPILAALQTALAEPDGGHAVERLVDE